MAANALIARIEPAPREYRVQPSNLDAEQALLGAVLVNNDAYYRVSDFLVPEHFFEELHRRIYEVTSSLIKAGKVATPITLKTFLGDADLGGLTVSQYLARLAGEATTVINAEDYGRAVYDLAIRRSLIGIGEGIITALESAHALAYATKLAAERPAEEVIVVNLSGRGDKDLDTVMKALGMEGGS